MRVVGVVIAALLTLGLAAFGVVATQKASGPASLVALAAHVVSPTQSASAPQAPVAEEGRFWIRRRNPQYLERTIPTRTRQRTGGKRAARRHSLAQTTHAPTSG